MNRSAEVTYILQCQNCGFSFTVTYPAAAEPEATPVACGHCRSNRWSAQPV